MRPPSYGLAPAQKPERDLALSVFPDNCSNISLFEFAFEKKLLADWLKQPTAQAGY
jgi:hypothetical protein